MRAARFRTRLLAILLAFALVPAAVLTVAWGAALWRAAPLVTGSGAWERVAASGESAIAAARGGARGPRARAAIDAHEQELRTSLEQARRYRYLARRSAAALGIAAILALGFLALIASRVAGHLSRQLSRPIDELVGYTEAIAQGHPLPSPPARRGAPEFETLRQRMRTMSDQLDAGRREALEAERLRAFRESARRVAHELKNPLTPIRLAIARLNSSASPDMREPLDVLATETERLERMARSFAQFGKMNEGAAAEVDVGDLVSYAAQSSVPAHVSLALDVEPDLPLVSGHYDSLVGAVSNVILNAVEACSVGGEVKCVVTRATIDGRDAVRVTISDTGRGIDTSKLDAIWEPYITDKPGGTGLGLTIARQAVHAHGGAVFARSERGRGTTIEMVIPVRPTLQV